MYDAQVLNVVSVGDFDSANDVLQDTRPAKFPGCQRQSLYAYLVSLLYCIRYYLLGRRELGVNVDVTGRYNERLLLEYRAGKQTATHNFSHANICMVRCDFRSSTTWYSVRVL